MSEAAHSAPGRAGALGAGSRSAPRQPVAPAAGVGDVRYSDRPRRPLPRTGSIPVSASPAL